MSLFLSLSVSVSLPISLSASHEVLVVICLDMREGKPQGNAWQGVLSMIPGSSLHSLAVTVGEYKGVIKECCHVTVTNTVWNRDVRHRCRLWAVEMCIVCVCTMSLCVVVRAKRNSISVFPCQFEFSHRRFWSKLDTQYLYQKHFHK